MDYSVIGDICPARMVEVPMRGIVSQEIADRFGSRFVVANLEAPIANNVDESLDHLVFQGRADLLKDLGFVDLFSLANNHINDLGDAGMQSTTDNLERHNYKHGGIFHEAHSASRVGSATFIFSSDMMNIPFSESSRFNYLYMFSDELLAEIENASNANSFVVLYIHTGLLFCKLPSPMIRKRIHQLIDAGADLVLTAHSHCFGAVEEYKNVVICYNLGDFLMDGQSMRRRTSMIFNFSIPNVGLSKNERLNYEIDFCQNHDFHVSKLKGVSLLFCRLSFSINSLVLKLPKKMYSLTFNVIYRLNLISHVWSTLMFMFRKRGVRGAIMQLVRRKDEVVRYFSWIRRDRRETSTDYDAIDGDRKKITTKDLL